MAQNKLLKFILYRSLPLFKIIYVNLFIRLPEFSLGLFVQWLQFDIFNFIVLGKSEWVKENLTDSMEILILSVEAAKQHSLSEILNLKRALGQEAFEKNAAQKAANDLRNMIKKSESEKLEQNHIIQELKQRISGN